MHAVRHPVESAAYAAGFARGVATAALRFASGDSPSRDTDTSGTTATEPVVPDTVDAEAETSSEPPAEPQRVGLEPGERLAAEAEEVPPVQPTPGRPGEAFENEPSAPSRDSQHGGPGDSGDVDELDPDAWRDGDEVDAGDAGPDVTTPVGTTAADEGHNPDTGETDLQQPDTPPLMDDSTAKSVMSESETLRKAAEKDPED
jgi:hypothetical protein